MFHPECSGNLLIHSLTKQQEHSSATDNFTNPMTRPSTHSRINTSYSSSMPLFTRSHTHSLSCSLTHSLAQFLIPNLSHLPAPAPHLQCSSSPLAGHPSRRPLSERWCGRWGLQQRRRRQQRTLRRRNAAEWQQETARIHLCSMSAHEFNHAPAALRHKHM